MGDDVLVQAVGFVDGVEPATPLLLLGLSGVLALAAAAATVVPVRRAPSAGMAGTGIENEPRLRSPV